MKIKFPKKLADLEIDGSNYDKDNPHNLPAEIVELGYIQIIAKKGRTQAEQLQMGSLVDSFTSILDNVKILIDKLG